MVGIPLMNLGNALAGLTQGYQNYQTNALNNAIRQLQLSQAQRQQQAATLAGLGLSAGLLNQQPGANAPIQPISSPQPPPPGQPSQPAAGTPPPPAVPVGTTVPLGTPGPGQPGFTPPADATPAPADLPPPDPGFPEGGQTDPGDPSKAADKDYRDLPDMRRKTLQQPPPQPQQPAPASPAAQQQPPAASTPAAGTSPQDVTVALPGGQSVNISDLFSTLDTSKLAQGLAKLAPAGTDPATIYEATSDLLKLANGNKEQQIQAATLGKLLGIQMQVQGRSDVAEKHEAAATGRTEMTTTAAGQRTEAQQAGADRRAQLAANTRLAVANINAYVKTQTASANLDFKYYAEGQKDQRAAARLQQGTDKLLLAARQANALDVSREVGTIRAQLQTIKPDASGAYSPEQQAQMAKYAKRLDQLNQQLAADAAAVDPSAQPPAQ